MQKHNVKQKDQTGVTLIELLITIAIVGIIAAVALPLYNDNVTESRRSDGYAAILNVQSQMERHMFDNNSYPEELSDMAGFAANSIDSDEGYYAVSIVTPTAACPVTSCYQILGTAQGAQATDGNLELHSDGTKVGNW